MARNSGIQKRNRAIVKAKRLPCSLALPGCPGIDYAAKYPAPNSFTVDHIVPFARGGSDSLVNLAPACRYCNRRKSDGPNPAKVIKRSRSVVIPDGL